MTNEISDSVLYYPSIEFADEKWVKASLLLWDKIYRIVPRNYQPKDKLDVTYAVESGLIRNIQLEREDVNITADNFLTFCEDLPFIPAGLEESEYDRIHPDKIDARLYPHLEDIAAKFDEEGWIKMSPQLAKGYMFILSKVVGERRNLPRATGDKDCWSIAPYFVEDANFSEYVYNRDAEGFYSSLVISDLIPANIAEIPMTSIIDFVEERRDIRAEFRKRVVELCNRISNCESKEHVRILIDDFVDDFENAKQEFKKSMAFFNEDARTSLMTTGIPVGLTAFGAFGLSADPFSLTNIFGSVFVGAVAAYNDYRKVKAQERTDSSASYLFDMETKLKPNDMDLGYNRIFSRNIEEFIND
jgi:hypothetical protein